VEIHSLLVGMLATRSPALYPRFHPEDDLEAIENAAFHKIKAWDCYLIKLAKSLGNRIIYTIDESLRSMLDITVINPFPGDLVKGYYAYLKSMLS